MTSTLYQEWLKNRLWSKSSNFETFKPYDFVQIPPACGANTYYGMCRETSDFRCQHQKRTVTHKSFNVKFTGEIHVPLGYFV